MSKSNTPDSKESKEESTAEEIKGLDTILHIQKCLTEGRKIDERYLGWAGMIKTNKDVAIEMSDEKGKLYSITIPKGKQWPAGLVLLQRLIQRVMQEGPEQKRNDWFATGAPRHENPLSFEIVSEGLNPNSPGAYKQMQASGKIPTLG